MGSVESVESHTIEGLHQELKGSVTATRKKALDKLLQLSANAANAKLMGASRLVEDLVPFIGEDREVEERTKALDLQCNIIAASSDAVARAGDESFGMIENLIGIVKSSDKNLKIMVKTLSLLRILSMNDDIDRRMSSDKLGLVELLLTFARDDKIDKESRILSLCILKNISSGSDTKVRILTSWPGLVEYLLNLIKSSGGSAEAFLNALQILWNLSGNMDSTVSKEHNDLISKMGSSNLGVIECMISVITGKLKVDSKIKDESISLAYKIIWYLSRNKDNRIRMGSQKLNLIELLISTVQQIPTSSNQLFALNILQNLATNSGSNGPNKMAGEKIAFIETLVHLLDKSDKEKDIDTFDATLGILKNLSHNTDCQRRMGAFSLGLVEFCIEIINKTSFVSNKKIEMLMPAFLIKRSIFTLEILFNLSLNKSNEVRMTTPKLGFVDILIEIISNPTSTLRLKALGIIWNLAANLQNQKSFGGKPSCDIIDQLVDIAVDEDDSDVSMKALAALKNFSQCSDNQVHMCSNKLVDFLISKLRIGYTSNKAEAPCMTLSLGIIANLSSHGSNKMKIGMKQDGSVDILVKILKNENLSALNQIKVLNVLWNLSLHREVKARLAANTLGLTDVIIEMFIENRYKSNLNPKDKALFFEANGKALSILWNISDTNLNIILIELHQNFSLIGNDKVGFLQLLIRFFAVDRGDARIIALKTLFNLCRSKEMKVKMANPNLGLKTVIESFTKDEEYEVEIRNLALDILFSLKHETSKIDIGDKDLLDNYHDDDVKNTHKKTVTLSLAAAHEQDNHHHEMFEAKEDIVYSPYHIHDHMEAAIDQDVDNDVFDSHHPILNNLMHSCDHDAVGDDDHLLEYHRSDSRKPSTFALQEGANYSITDTDLYTNRNLARTGEGYSMSNLVESEYVGNSAFDGDDYSNKVEEEVDFDVIA